MIYVGIETKQYINNKIKLTKTKNTLDIVATHAKLTTSSAIVYTAVVNINGTKYPVFIGFVRIFPSAKYVNKQKPIISNIMAEIKFANVSICRTAKKTYMIITT
jgi:hypothetical protein